MELTEQMQRAFLDRAIRVIKMGRAGDHEVKVINNEMHVLGLTYLAAIVGFDLGNFGLIAPTRELIDGLRIQCDPQRLAQMPAEFLHDPVLIMRPGVQILDGNHRIFLRWQLGDRLIPAYCLPDSAVKAGLGMVDFKPV